MWQKSINKTVFTLNIDNYAPEITELTYPWMKHYAHKIGAEFYIIKERKFEFYPPVYEKLQIYELGQEMQNDWNIFFDSDTVVHPELVDVTSFLKKDTVAHNGADMAAIRWRYDSYFLRDGRNIGSCNWCTIASDWCIELWKPIDDLTYTEIVDNIYPVVVELNTVIKPEHLIDDYTLSRNIAKYGFKFKTLVDLFKDEINLPAANFFYHEYTISIEEKVKRIKNILKQWELD